MLELDLHTPLSKIEDMRATGSIKHLRRGAEGANHWYDLYLIQTQDIKCGWCDKRSKFMLFTHWHTGETETEILCEDHSPSTYMDILDQVTAG